MLDASPKAQELARILAAVPLIPPVMRLAQRRFLKNSEYWHLAEVFFSGLLQRSALGPEKASVLETWYEFRPGIRELLLESSSVSRTTEIWREIGSFIQEHYGSLREFPALIPNPAGSIQDMVTDQQLYFAEVNAAVFMTWGGEYAIGAQELRKQVETRKQRKREINEIPTLQQDNPWLLQQSIENNQGQVNCLIFSPDKQLIATAGEDGTICLWNLTGELINQFEAHQGEAWVITFVATNRDLLVSSGKE